MANEEVPSGHRAELSRELLVTLQKMTPERVCHLVGLHVYKTASLNDWKVRLQGFSTECAPDLFEKISSPSVRVFGVGWGGTVASAVNGLFTARRSPKAEPTLFIPTCGEPTGPERLNISSSVLARTLDEAVNGGFDHHLSLAGTPAMIPYGVEDGFADEVRKKVIEVGQQYREIFVGDPTSNTPLISRLNGILTSLAPPKQPGRMYPNEQILSGVETSSIFDAVAYDLGGANVAKREVPLDKQEVVNRLNRRWTGIQLRHYEQCAQEAVERQTPGVIVVAIGNNKAESVIDAVRRGMVNHLLIDEDLASEMFKILSSSQQVGRG